MQIGNLLAASHLLLGIVGGVPADDMRSLSESCENAAVVLNSSLNNTAALVRQRQRSKVIHGLIDDYSEYLRPDTRDWLASWRIDGQLGNEWIVHEFFIRTGCPLL